MPHVIWPATLVMVVGAVLNFLSDLLIRPENKELADNWNKAIGFLALVWLLALVVSFLAYLDD